MGYDKLERNLIDIIKEEQAKLGFFREDIRLYYPLSSLNHFFDAADTADEMQARLEVLPASITDKLGDIEVSHKGDRFCFHIPQQGTVYVHDNTAGNEFIKELVNLVGRHGCTMDEILDLFHTHSDNVITEEMDNGEFDRLIRFGDKPVHFHSDTDHIQPPAALAELILKDSSPAAKSFLYNMIFWTKLLLKKSSPSCIFIKASGLIRLVSPGIRIAKA